MATTINSGYADSPKLTANIADHADVYGGRALVFDGVVDYLQASVGYTLTDATFSLWFNKDTSHTGYIFNIYESTSSGWGLRIASNDVGIYDDSNANDAVVYNTGISSNIWYHIAVTISSNEQKLYLNGELKGSGTNIASSLSGIDGDLFIGSRRSDQQYFDGSMCDFKIFDTALTEAQVQELYKKPENTPSAVQDNLVAWYPMIEGNPESPQSIVYDHSEKGLSSEKFGTNDNDWDDSGSNIDYSNGIISYTGSGIGNASVRYDGTTYGAFTFETDKLYKIVFTVSTATQARFKMQTSGSIIFLSSTTYSSGTYTRYIKALSTYNGQGFVLRGETSGANFDITSISLKEVTNDIVAYYPLDGSSSRGNGTDDVTTGEVLGDELVDTTTYTGGSAYAEEYIRTSNVPTLGGIYKLTFDVDSYTSGSFYFTTNTGTSPRVEPSVYNAINTSIGSQVGSETYYLKINKGGGFKFKASNSGYSGSVSNISLKEVTSNTGVLY